MIRKLNNEKIAHNFFFLLILLILPFLGFAKGNFSLVFIGLGLSVVLKTILSCDIRLLFLDLILPFITFRSEFTFDNFPRTLILMAIIFILAFIIIPLKHIFIHGKPKFNGGSLTRSFVVIGIIMFISPIVRRVLSNEPAFPDYAGGYNIIFGYIGGILCLLFPFVLLFVSTFKTKDKSPLPNLMYFLALFLVLELCYCIFHEDTTLDVALSTYGVGWGNKNAFMIILELTFPFTAYIFSKNWKRVDSLLLLMISILVGLSSDSRAGQITIIAAIPFLIWLAIPRVKYYKTFVFFSYVVAFALGFAALIKIPVLQDSVKRLFDSIFHNDNFSSVVTGRDIFWEWISTYVFKDKRHFLFGGSFSYLFEMYQAFNHTTTIDLWLAHNSFMTFLAVGGVLGLLSLIYHFGDVFVCILKNAKTQKLLFFTFLLIGFVHGLGDNTLFNIQFMLPYIFVLQDIDRVKKNNKVEL